MATSFGTIGEFIRNATVAYTSRDTGPVFINNKMQTSIYNTGSHGAAAILHNEIYSPDDFLWGLNKWDDGIHTVGA